MNPMIRFILVACFLCASGCASADRGACHFEPLGRKGSYSYYKFTAYADLAYPPDSPRAESIRLQWLKDFLVESGHPNAEYEVTSRSAIHRTGKIYDVFYSVRVREH